MSSHKRRKRASRAKITLPNPLGLPELAASKKRDPNGCYSERTRQQNDDPNPTAIVLEARARHLGLSDSKTDLPAMNSAMLGEPQGTAIFLDEKSADERNRLWKTYCDMDKAEEVYFRRILGAPRHAKVGKIEFIPESITTENSAPPDSRDNETKDRDAVNAWMHWRGLAQRLGAKNMTALFDGMLLRADLVRDGKITGSGLSFVSSLRLLTAEAERGRIRR